jgi:hypothetical protein
MEIVILIFALAIFGGISVLALMMWFLFKRKKKS